MKQLLVFDWDGTLMDSTSRIVNCMRKAMLEAEQRPAAEEQVAMVIGLSLERAIETLLPDADQDICCLVRDRYRHHYLIGDSTPTPLFPDVREVLDRLRTEGYWLAVATGKSRQGLEKALDESRLRDYFLAYECADSTRSKPDPEMLLLIMEELGVAATGTLMIGDTDYDIQMAHNAGVDALAVTYGAHSRPRLAACRPLGCMNRLSDVFTYLDR
jgi:phosphoglycolate phosphatase